MNNEQAEEMLFHLRILSKVSEESYATILEGKVARGVGNLQKALNMELHDFLTHLEKEFPFNPTMRYSIGESIEAFLNHSSIATELVDSGVKINVHTEQHQMGLNSLAETITLRYSN